eukprot:Phypoly_transcript_12055.p1 GENE.Phypoly_transcript_12055~~Phypoly_transcript_12055.p1  ORF type:complete len:361 (+),score=52.83 Phypoly_transcript_12055:65-1084(+)
MDWLASVDAYPQPDQKIRTTSLLKMSGGNAANVSVCVSRLGIPSTIITKLGNDEIGSAVLKDFKDEKVDTSLVTIYNGATPFSYIIVDTSNKSRTIINTPGQDLEENEVNHNFTSGDLLFLDGRHSLAAKKLAKIANFQNIPVVLELENPTRPLIWELLPYADFIVSSAVFPPSYLKQKQESNQTNCKDPFQFLVSKCPRAKWLISTFGKKGSILIEKLQPQNEHTESEPTLDTIINDLVNQEPVATNAKTPIVQSKATKDGLYTVYHCSIWPTDPNLIIDTTGAGDTFNGGILFSLVNKFAIPKMLQFATYLAAENCKHIGARGGMKFLQDIDMSMFE